MPAADHGEAARSPKGEGALALDELDGHDGRAHRARRPRHAEQRRASASAGWSIASSASSAATDTYLELQRHLLRDEEADNHALRDLAAAFHVPVVATNGVRFAEPADRPLYDVLTCIRHKTTLERAGRRLSCNAERYLKSPAQMAQLFADLPEALARVRRAGRSPRLHDGGSRLPLSRISGAGGRDDGVVPAQDHAGRRARALPADRAARARGRSSASWI